MANQKLNVEITAQDKASAKIEQVARKADRLDGETADIKVDADTSGVDSALDGLGSKLDGLGVPVTALAGPAGVGALAAGFLAAANNAADAAIDADNLAALTGDSVEEASRLNAIWKSTGADTKDLQDVMLQMNGVLSTNADIAKTLGVNLNDGATVGQRFQQVADALDKIPDAAKRSQIASQVFGEEGVRQYNALRQSVGDVGEAMENVAEGQVFSEDDVANAREFKAELAKVKAELTAIVNQIGGDLLPQLAELTGAFGDVVEVGQEIKILDIGRTVLKWTNPIRVVGDELRGPVVDGLKDVSGWLGIGGDEAEEAADKFHVLESATGDLVDAVTDAIQAEADRKDNVAAVREELFRQGERTAEVVDRTEELAEAEKKAADAADRHRDAVDSVVEALEDQQNAALELVGGDIAVRDAQRDAAEAATELNEVLENQETTLGEAGAAIDSAADAQLRAATAAADYRAKQMEANGQSVDAKTKAQLLKEELERLAGQLDGPLLASIQQYIDQLNAIPRTIGTTIVLNRPGRVGDFVPTLGGGQIVGATGGIVNRPTTALIGEAGPEAVIPLSQSAGNGPLPAGLGGTYNVTINVAQMLTPQQVLDAIKKHERFNGPGWRS